MILKTEKDIDLISNINFQDMFGQTYLHTLVKNDSPLLDYFLSKGPNLNIKNKEGKTPIFYAKTVDTIDKLINQGASILIKDNKGKTVSDINPKLIGEYITFYAKKFGGN